MLSLTKKGLYCAAGNFYIDPNARVDHAVITHAHSDHARRGSKKYYCVSSGVELLKIRLGESISVHSFSYGEKINFGDVTVSFHPAGHILGSSQIRIAFNGEVWVVSGDYKREIDQTCERFETVVCDVFITEATFGEPSFSWQKETDFGEEIFSWWQENANQGFNSVLFAYSLGKAQRILGNLYSHTDRAVLCHAATEKINACYRSQGIDLAPSIDIDLLNPNKIFNRELFLVPPSFMKSPSSNLLGHRYKTAFASGWVASLNHYYDTGFIMSDHADWHDLLRTILESKASSVYVQHRGAGSLVKKLKQLGLTAFPIDKLKPRNPNQLAFL